MDPPGSFKVDVDINNKLLELLELGVYLGALVYLDDGETISNDGLINKRVRLSYSLSAYFSLLSRDFKEIKLSWLRKKMIDRCDCFIKVGIR